VPFSDIIIFDKGALFGHNFLARVPFSDIILVIRS
jgi:hypothetical protein